MDRRSFISNLTVSSASLALACASLGRRAESFANTGDLAGLRAVGYGDLLPTASRNTGETFLALPRGFEYNVIGKKGVAMSDGRPTPTLHDGMWTFRVKKELRIVRNHEVSFTKTPVVGTAIGGGNHYDETAPGGTTTLVIDPNTQTVVRDFVSLSGTLINCAGGPTPWGSWVSCEETTLGPTVRTNARTGVKTGGYPKPHGYCFEVLASADGNIAPTPLKAMGRFEHEAIAVDKRTGTVYLTEDFATAGFYRFLPKRNKRLAEGGVLQMLAVKDKRDYDTRTGQKPGTVLATTWFTIDNPDPAEADVDPNVVYKEGKSKGGATFNRLEGCCSKDGKIYFTSTSGGDAKGGQIWRYEAVNKSEGRLTLVFESPNREVLDMPDNICMMPKSKLLLICEDSDYVGEGGTPDNYLRILTPDGRIADFSKNIVPKMERGEFAGTTFSPDGKTLFFNIQQLGATFAVWGDWSKFKA